ncbi:MAG TPA: inorganic phosphate transporter, partial [Candidatus Polarisedimenticolia bacterium]|nr:inorganic phosphate transporter [Candidatus Polarisedimenticolia bacterium]
VGISAQTLATVMHTASAAFVGFARGLNDTPKLLGLLLGASVLSPWAGTAALAAALAIGGLVGARRVAETLSRKVTVMNQGQGLAGNLATSLLVAAASRVDLPVSTTHVSTGSIFGVGAAGGVLRWRPVAAILGAWMTTLPLAAALGAAAMWALK